MSIERSTSKTARLVQSFITVIMSILGLQRIILCWCWLARHLAKDCSICHWSSLWVVCRGCCLYNYRALPSVCLSSACGPSPISSTPANRLQDGCACVEVSTQCSPSLPGWPVCASPLRAWSPATAFHGVWDSAGPACPDCYRPVQLRRQWTTNMEQSASRS